MTGGGASSPGRFHRRVSTAEQLSQSLEAPNPAKLALNWLAPCGGVVMSGTPLVTRTLRTLLTSDQNLQRGTNRQRRAAGARG